MEIIISTALLYNFTFEYLSNFPGTWNIRVDIFNGITRYALQICGTNTRYVDCNMSEAEWVIHSYNLYQIISYALGIKEINISFLLNATSHAINLINSKDLQIYYINFHKKKSTNNLQIKNKFMYYRTARRIILRERRQHKRIRYEVRCSCTGADSQASLHVGKSRW